MAKSAAKAIEIIVEYAAPITPKLGIRIKLRKIFNNAPKPDGNNLHKFNSFATSQKSLITKRTKNKLTNTRILIMLNTSIYSGLKNKAIIDGASKDVTIQNKPTAIKEKKFKFLNNLNWVLLSKLQILVM